MSIFNGRNPDSTPKLIEDVLNYPKDELSSYIVALQGEFKAYQAFLHGLRGSCKRADFHSMALGVKDLCGAELPRALRTAPKDYRPQFDEDDEWDLADKHLERWEVTEWPAVVPELQHKFAVENLYDEPDERLIFKDVPNPDRTSRTWPFKRISGILLWHRVSAMFKIDSNAAVEREESTGFTLRHKDRESLVEFHYEDTGFEFDFRGGDKAQRHLLELLEFLMEEKFYIGKGHPVVQKRDVHRGWTNCTHTA